MSTITTSGLSNRHRSRASSPRSTVCTSSPSSFKMLASVVAVSLLSSTTTIRSLCRLPAATSFPSTRSVATTRMLHRACSYCCCLPLTTISSAMMNRAKVRMCAPSIVHNFALTQETRVSPLPLPYRELELPLGLCGAVRPRIAQSAGQFVEHDVHSAQEHGVRHRGCAFDHALDKRGLDSKLRSRIVETAKLGDDLLRDSLADGNGVGQNATKLRECWAAPATRA
jgi:hypothetical protein